MDITLIEAVAALIISIIIITIYAFTTVWLYTKYESRALKVKDKKVKARLKRFAFKVKIASITLMFIAVILTFRIV